ncbi:hypothetical protein J1614_002812 [Plenodomus biglobosus]|nr:hypothetical protein J1614_002812 [Plenodomus biglobosus]
MFSLPRISLPSFLRPTGNHPTVTLPSVEIHDIETSAEKRARTLKHLLKANHANHSIIYHNLRFHNHTPHILGSAYLLGATAEQLNEIYEKEAEGLEPWTDAPGEITTADWRDFLGRREYQRAFIDFFEDQLVNRKYDLSALLDEFLLGGKEPLINTLVSGLAHPLIHLGYAYELQSKTVAIEALALGACFYSPLHKYIDDPKYTKPSPHSAPDGPTSLIDLLHKVRNDKRFDGLYPHRSGDISKVFSQREDAFLEYWNAWEIVDPTAQFHAAQQTAVAFLTGTASPAASKFDFFFVHVLTSSHAIRILLPLVPAKFHVSLLRQWWLFALAVYVAQTRPEIEIPALQSSDARDCEGRSWKHVLHMALAGPWAKDAHYVKALRAMKVAEETWEKPGAAESSYWLRAAVEFADGFQGWAGFGADAEENELAYPERQ